jgi:hypothetical protein
MNKDYWQERYARYVQLATRLGLDKLPFEQWLKMYRR